MAEKRKRNAGRIVKWVLAVFMLVGSTTYWFSLASVIFALLGVALLPIAPVEKVVNKLVPRKQALRGILVFVIFVVGCWIAPEAETDTPQAAAPLYSETIPAISDSTVSVTESTTTPAAESPEEPTAALVTESTAAPQDSKLEVHFIDVGQADAALVLCDGKAMLIDGGNGADSSLLYTYLKKHDISHLDYVIGTHAHEDHIGGIAGALNYATVGVAYCPTTISDSDAFRNFEKALEKRNVSITVPSPEDRFSLGSADCTVLAVNTDPGDPNNASIVLRIVYGNTSFLFAADAEREVEQAILSRGREIRSTVLKVGHHGSESSTGYVWLREVRPQYAVISVGKDNSYGHPTEDVLSRLRDAEVKTFRTDLQGDILCVSDGSELIFTTQRNADADVFRSPEENTPQKSPTRQTEAPTTEAAAESGIHYVVNKNTKKFHYPSCSSADDIKPSNRWDYQGTREELIGMGYVPCKRCNP